MSSLKHEHSLLRDHIVQTASKTRMEEVKGAISGLWAGNAPGQWNAQQQQQQQQQSPELDTLSLTAEGNNSSSVSSSAAWGFPPGVGNTSTARACTPDLDRSGGANGLSNTTNTSLLFGASGANGLDGSGSVLPAAPCAVLSTLSALQTELRHERKGGEELRAELSGTNGEVARLQSSVEEARRSQLAAQRAAEVAVAAAKLADELHVEDLKVGQRRQATHNSLVDENRMLRESHVTKYGGAGGAGGGATTDHGVVVRGRQAASEPSESSEPSLDSFKTFGGYFKP